MHWQKPKQYRDEFTGVNLGVNWAKKSGHLLKK
jgi:hypothetical protein